MVSRDDVLDAAMALLHEHGVEGLSMRRLARALGTSYQVVYSRVGAKPDVVRALHDRCFDDLMAAVDTLPTSPGTVAHVHAVAASYLEHALADPLRFEVMFGNPVPAFRGDERTREREHECFRRTWIAAVGSWLDTTDPDRPSGTATRLAWRLWTAVHGITVVHLAGHRSPSGDPATEVRAVVDLLLAHPRGPT